MNQTLRSRFTATVRPHLLPAAILIIATIALYARILDHEFLVNWDDDRYVTDNPAIRGITLANIATAFSSFYVGNYAPVQILSYMVDYSLWGLRAGGFLLTNILLHTVNGLLFYAMVLRMAGRRLVAVVAAAIFLLHPVQVESVAWVAQRKTLVAMGLFLLSFLLYSSYRDKGWHVGKGSYLLSLGAFSCALLAKSVAVILPPALILYDICFPPAAPVKKRLADKLPFIVAAGAVALLALVSQSPETGGGRRDTLYGNAPQATLYTMLPIFCRYLGMIFNPTGLSAVYDPPIRIGVDTTVLLSALFLGILLAGICLLYRYRRPLFFWSTLFILGLVPVSQIVPLVTLMNDRYLYFPLLGAAPLLALLLVFLVGKIPLASSRPFILGLILLPLPLLASARTGVWRDSITLWSDVVAKNPTSLLACLGLGDTYAILNQPEKAIPVFQRALSLDPGGREALHRLAEEHLELKEYATAGRYLKELTRRYPAYSAGFLTLGDLCLTMGDYSCAESAYLTALRLTPSSNYALNYLGITYVKMNNYAAARTYYQRALQSGGANETLRALISP